MVWATKGASVTEWLMRLALKLLVPQSCGSGSNPMRGSCQLLTGFKLLVHSQEQFVPPAVETDRHI